MHHNCQECTRLWAEYALATRHYLKLEGRLQIAHVSRDEKTLAQLTPMLQRADQERADLAPFHQRARGARQNRIRLERTGRRRQRLTLEQQLQRKLNLARTSQVPPHRPRRRNLTERRDRQIVLRLPEIRMIEQVERLAPELQRYPLLDLRVLGDREVDVLQTPARSECFGRRCRTRSPDG